MVPKIHKKKIEEWEALTLDEKLDLVIRSIEFELDDNEANGTPF
ncbi:MAG: hypothetical protein WAM07_13015 [Halobacillus sp.]